MRLLWFMRVRSRTPRLQHLAATPPPGCSRPAERASIQKPPARCPARLHGLSQHPPPVREPTCHGTCRSGCTALSTWAAAIHRPRSGPRSQCRQPGLRIPHDLQPPPAVQRTGTPGRWVAGAGSPDGPRPRKPSLFSPSRLPPFPPKTTFFAATQLQTYRGRASLDPRRDNLYGYTAPARPRLSKAFRQVGQA